MYEALATGNNNKNLKQKNQLTALKRKEHWMKWALWAAAIIILLLLLVLGYATDWTRGLRKDNTVTPSTSLDSLNTETGTADTANTTNNGQGTNRTTNTGTTERTTNNTSTTNTTTTTNNTTTPGSGLSSDLLSLYSDTNVGESLEAAIQRAEDLGLAVNCDENLVVRECRVTDGNGTVTLRSLLGFDDITAVLEDFNQN